ncbi:MAG: GtrA family protein [Acholeplasmataceae bacterium]|jgi:putative flippase GtrA|nr:GtrA family protein [Acholeplasmataceae bacterium]
MTHKKEKQNDSESLIQAIKFFFFSISAGIIQALSFTFLFEVMNLIYWPSYLIALSLSVIWNFTLNRKFTFKSSSNIPIAMLKVALFYAIFTPLSTWWGHELTSIHWNEYLVLFITMVINLVSEFIYTKHYVFKDSINSALVPKCEN